MQRWQYDLQPQRSPTTLSWDMTCGSPQRLRRSATRRLWIFQYRGCRALLNDTDGPHRTFQHGEVDDRSQPIWQLPPTALSTKARLSLRLNTARLPMPAVLFQCKRPPQLDPKPGPDVRRNLDQVIQHIETPDLLWLTKITAIVRVKDADTGSAHTSLRLSFLAYRQFGRPVAGRISRSQSPSVAQAASLDRSGGNSKPSRSDGGTMWPDGMCT